MNFNINDSVKVKLTEIGLNEMKRQHNELNFLIPNLPDFTPRITDDNGYSTFQMHDLMNRFGHMMVAGLQLPFEPDIKLIRSTEL